MYMYRLQMCPIGEVSILLHFLSLSCVQSRLSISSASSDIGEGVVSVCHDNQCVSSPTNLSPELDYNAFPTSILGSDGESDPFESSSPPDSMDNGELVVTEKSTPSLMCNV